MMPEPRPGTIDGRGVWFEEAIPVEDLEGVSLPGLVFWDGTEVLGSDETVPEATVGAVSLLELIEALRLWTARDVLASTLGVKRTPRRRTGEREELLYLHLESGELRAIVWTGREPGEDLAFEATLEILARPLVRRWSGRAVLDADPFKARELTLQLMLEDPTRLVADLLSLAAELDALLSARDGGELSLRVAVDLVATGHAGALVGTRECGWLDAKGAPYRFRDGGKRELVIDVAAFANSGGGLIVIPATTELVDGAEVIEEIRQMGRELVDPKQIKDTVAEYVYPAPVGVEVEFVDVGAGRGQLYIHVPPQVDARKPFLVDGRVVDGAVHPRSVLLPRRDGDRITFDDVGAIHAALRAHPTQGDRDDHFLERVRLDGMPQVFRDILSLARRAGLRAETHPGGFSVYMPDGDRVDVLDAR